MSGGIWIASYVALWAAVVLLAFCVIVLLRQIGVLHARIKPMGAHFAGEGPPLGEPAPSAGPMPYRSGVTLVVFTSPSCEVCRLLKPSLRALERTYDDLALIEIEAGDATRPTFRAFNVNNTPYAVAVDRAGIVRGRGVVNTLEQVELLVKEALEDRAVVDL